MSIVDLISSSLRQKYGIMQQQADADALRAKADANLNNVRAGLLPDEAKAQIGLQGAQAYKTREEGQAVAPLAQSRIGLDRAMGTNYYADANLSNTRSRLMPFESMADIAYKRQLAQQAGANAYNTANSTISMRSLGDGKFGYVDPNTILSNSASGFGFLGDLERTLARRPTSAAPTSSGAAGSTGYGSGMATTDWERRQVRNPYYGGAR